ncbi:MAG: Type 1 glutamine amidotransferase-like domain-containing protein [Acetatifactor sp.]
MRAFLNGGGAGKKTVLVNQRFYELLDISNPLLYVPLAMESEKYPSCLEWIKGEFGSFVMPPIEMITSGEELCSKQLNQYCAIFVGGGNTYKLLRDLKVSGSFEKIKIFLENDGIVFGGSAGAIILGEDIESCKYADKNEVGLTDTVGFNVLKGVSLLCHYTNEDEQKTKLHTDYLLELSLRRRVVALPEEDTVFVNGDRAEVIGNRPYYVFRDGKVFRHEMEKSQCVLLLD